MSNWICIESELPPVGRQVIGFNHKWIDNDLNPEGTQVGFLNDHNEFVSAHRWNTKDGYITTISDNTKPEYWMYTPILDM